MSTRIDGQRHNVTKGGRTADRTAKRAAARLAAAKRAQVARRKRLAVVWGTALAGVAAVAGLIAFVAIDSPGSDTKAGAGTGASAAAPASAGASANPETAQKPVVTAGSGELTELKVTTLVPGNGPEVTKGQALSVRYVGVSFKTGVEFDSSWSRGEPFGFTVGQGRVIAGWDQGLVGVTVGSRVQLDIPSAMAYGDNPANGAPAGPLRFVVDVLSAS